MVVVADDDRRPSVAGYWVGGAVVVVGCLAAIVWFVVGLMSFARQVDHFQRVPVGEAGGRLNLDAGSWTGYYEGPGASQSEVVVPELELELEVTPVDGGDTVPISIYHGSLTYDIGGSQGRALFTFTAPRPGEYTLRAIGSGRGRIAVGRGIGRRLVSAVVGAFVIGILGFCIGVPLLIVTAVRRSRARRRHRRGPRAPTRRTRRLPRLPPPPGGRRADNTSSPASWSRSS